MKKIIFIFILLILLSGCGSRQKEYDTSFCADLGDETAKDLCHINLATNNEDRKICDEVKGLNEKKLCNKYVEIAPEPYLEEKPKVLEDLRTPICVKLEGIPVNIELSEKETEEYIGFSVENCEESELEYTIELNIVDVNPKTIDININKPKIYPFSFYKKPLAIGKKRLYVIKIDKDSAIKESTYKANIIIRKIDGALYQSKTFFIEYN